MADNEIDPFAAMGGGVKVNGGWVPKDHPLAQQAGAQPSTQPTTPTGYTDPSSVTTSGSVQGQADAAQTYSTTPGAPPPAYTSNAGSADVLRNSLLQRATQGTTIDTNDPAYRQQVDTYSAAQERARRDAQDANAERNFAAGMGSSGAADVESRAINEASSRDRAGFEANLAHSELLSRRQEITDALNGLGGLITGDQARALTKQLADLDAAIKRESMAQTGNLAQSDLALRQQLGQGGLNLDALRLQLANDQFNKNLGFQIGDSEARMNALALQSLLG